MKLSISILSSVLLATSTIAAPHPNVGLARRLQRRSRGHQGSTNTAIESSSSSTKTNSVGTRSDQEYSYNWSGAALKTPPTGQTFNAVEAKFTVPNPSVPAGVASSDGEYSASAWVGIDGNTYSTAILQTGIDFTVSTSGKVSFDAWYEWYPDYAYDFTLDISAGDEILMYINATTTTSGSATIENLTTSKTATKYLTSDSPLGGENAEWIIEDFEQNDSQVPFANFGNVTFSECVAYTSESTEGVSSATLLDLQNSSDEVLTDVEVIDDTSFSIAYTGSTTTSKKGNGKGHGPKVSFEKLKRYLVWGSPSTSGGL